jgi:hypothetical protein
VNPEDTPALHLSDLTAFREYGNNAFPTVLRKRLTTLMEMNISAHNQRRVRIFALLRLRTSEITTW